jgi:hypothetical protein
MSGNEASAIGSLRAINSSQQAFASSCANGFYADDLTDLGTAPSTTGGTPFISPDLGASDTVTKSGYSVTLDGTLGTAPATSCNGIGATALAGSYIASGTPSSPGSTGVRYFWTNTLGTIYTDSSAVPTGGSGVAPPTSTTSTPLQ